MCNVKEIGVDEVLDLMTEIKEELLQDDPHCIPCEGRDFFKGYYVGRITALYSLLGIYKCLKLPFCVFGYF